ncbi:Dihydrofolate reductase [compost metagenome]
MAITLIVAHDRSLGIGKNGKLPWNIKEDMEWFKENTMGKRIVMGRKTFESIGKVLPGRDNFVLSRDPNYSPPPGVITTAPYLGTDFVVIGGAEIYEQYMKVATHLIITEVRGNYNCDTFFPKYDLRDWRKTYSLTSKQCTFMKYERRW